LPFSVQHIAPISRMRASRFLVSLWCAASLAATVVAAAAPDDTLRAEESLRNGDLITAMALLRKAADEGYAPAQARLADLLDVAEQDAQAVALYRKAAEQGNAAGEFGLGRMLTQGEGVARDVAQGLQWIRRAAERSHVPAVEWLARAYRSGDLGLPRDLQEAARLEAKAKTLRDTAAEVKP
jgi:TPR repeat protein